MQPIIYTIYKYEFQVISIAFVMNKSKWSTCINYQTLDNYNTIGVEEKKRVFIGIPIEIRTNCSHQS